MNIRKLIAAGTAVLLLTGCGMPEVDFEGAESPLFVEDGSGVSAAKTESAVESTAKADGKKDESRADDREAEDSSAEDSKKTDSSAASIKTDSVPTDSGVAAGSTKDDTVETDTPVQLSVERLTKFEADYNDTDNVTYINSDVQYLVLGENDAKEYSRLADKLEALTEATVIDCEDTFDSFLDEAEAYYADAGDDFETFDINVSAVPTRCDSHIFSYFEKTRIKDDQGSKVTIAAHTINSETGRELTLSKVIADADALPEILADCQKEEYPDISEDQFADLLGEYEDTDYVWTLGYDGITFYFAEDEEVMALTVLRSEQKKLFKSIGEAVPDNYAVGLDMAQNFVFDLENDGTTDVLRIEGREDEESYFEGVTVTLNDESAVANFYSYGMSPTYVHTENGDYVYLFCAADNDYRQLNIFSLEDGRPSYSGYMDNAGARGRYIEEGNISAEILLTDPEAFDLSTRMDILSTYDASRSYYVGDTGMPKSDDTYYYADGELVLTNIEPITASIVNERGRVTKKNQTIKADTEWTIYRTDGVNVVDLILSDDRIARLELDSVKWPQTIDGEDITDLFDGIRFAG